jgi:hypothetical protein
MMDTEIEELEKTLHAPYTQAEIDEALLELARIRIDEKRAAALDNARNPTAVRYIRMPAVQDQG